MENTKKSISQIIKEINPHEEYSASHIVENQWVPWIETTLTMTAFLRSNEGRRYLKPIIFKQGSVMRYKIRGSDLIDTLKLREQGKLVIDYDKK